MLKQKEKRLFAKLKMEWEPVALKYCYSKPENIEVCDEVLSFCQFAKKAQVEKKVFYVDKEHDNCFGKMVLGMIEKPGLAASGQAGYDFGVFRSPAPNARLYHMISTLVPGACNYVIFAPLSLCDFDPDIVLCVATPEQGDILMRATSYISGDLWETKGSSVLACSWLFSYPYISGKVNYTITGLEHGMNRRKVYPHGLMLISIPYQKLYEVLRALEEMPWELAAMKEDEESKEALQKKMDHWQEMSEDFVLKK
jgi:uncharacterized protein (DUF169 family)